MAAGWGQRGMQRPSIRRQRQRHSIAGRSAVWRHSSAPAALLVMPAGFSVLRPLSKLLRVYCVQHAMFLTLAAAPHFCLQEEERERRMDFIPDESAINTEAIEVR